MNGKNPHYVSDSTLHRLVDGQLDSQEYQLVVNALENSEDGWRRCAIAFLENQALENELAVVDFDSISFSADTTLSAENEASIWEELLREEMELVQEESFDSAVEDEKVMLAETASLRTRLNGIWPNVLSGTAVALLVGFFTFQVMQSKSDSNIADAPNPGFTQVGNVDLISAEVPVRDSSLALEPNFLTRPSDFEYVLSPSVHKVSGYESIVHQVVQDGKRYDMPVQKIQFAPRRYDRFR